MIILGAAETSRWHFIKQLKLGNPKAYTLPKEAIEHFQKLIMGCKYADRPVVERAIHFHLEFYVNPNFMPVEELEGWFIGDINGVRQPIYKKKSFIIQAWFYSQEHEKMVWVAWEDVGNAVPLKENGLDLPRSC